MNVFIKTILAALCLAACSCKKEKPATDEPTQPGSRQLAMETLVKSRYIPWGLAHLPNGDLLFTERNGKFNLLKKGSTTPILLATRQVNTNGEGGLLSLAIDPLYTSNHYVFIYETKGSDNRVVRLKYENETLTEDQVILTGIPEAPNHDGGALKFGPDGFLYVGTGDAQVPSKAQDKSSLSGKILRIDRNGNAAPGNPFNSRIWSLGHRNVQGFTWTSAGTMLATEHGPSGEYGWCCHDEINLIQAGKNYGWPLAYAGQETDTLTPALIHSGTDTWAPSGCTYVPAGGIWSNCLVVATLRGQRLLRVYLNAGGNQVLATNDTLKNQLNRIRTVSLAPDGSLLFSSSNSGNASALLPEDDKIFRLYWKQN